MIRSQYLGYLVVLAFIVRTALLAQTAPINNMLSEAQKQTLHNEASSLLQKYRELPISPESPDFRLFAIIGKAAQQNAEFIDELINLTAIQEAPPDTTEKISPTRLSPAGRELLIIGGGVKELVQARLDRGDLTAQQIALLRDVVHFIELKAPTSTQGAAPLQPTGEQGETTKPSDIAATTAPPPSIQPSAPKKTTEAKSAASVPSEESSSSTSWSIIVVLIVAALGLLWLLLKRRS